MRLAHVGYVSDASAFRSAPEADTPFLLSALNDPTNVLLFFFGTVALALLVWYAMRAKRSQKILALIRAKTPSYRPLFPWMARLSLGIALIGAGSGGDLLNPAFHAPGWVAWAELATGFLLLLGLFTGMAASATLVLFVMALAMSPYALGSLDVVALSVLLLVMGDSRPGADDLFNIPSFIAKLGWRDWLPTVLRVGVGVSMIYLALVEKLLAPHAMEAVVTEFGLTNEIPVSAAMWVLSTGLTELVVGLCLLIGFQTRLFAGIAFLVLTLSFFFFKEEVYAHITLFGLLSILVVSGGGAYAIKERVKSRIIHQTSPE
jgi:uncharacterized membrane protein YphA (DoxX/SURF4 family)